MSGLAGLKPKVKSQFSKIAALITVPGCSRGFFLRVSRPIDVDVNHHSIPSKISSAVLFFANHTQHPNGSWLGCGLLTAADGLFVSSFV
ncbi:hypothetical protein PGQ11_009339 [Apiospora arundinis]|uniref:Uncharacterized protein n=1 Tax=Apiospora arundinis TaxID=335852 RepID=A0ABR2IHV0_9PEZI